MKLLITGGAGFIGVNFVHYWLRKYPNDEIRVIDALTYASNIESLKPVINKIRFYEANINNRSQVSEAVGGVDAVVHFAAESHVDRSVYDPAKYWHTNVHGTLVLLEESKKAGVTRFHHISTDEVYGELPLNSNLKFTESTPYSPRPDNIYALSKAEADHVVLDFCKNNNMFATISNCSNNYGPFQFPEKFIPIIVSNLIDGIKVPLHGDGRNVRDWIHVLDHASAIDAILQKGKSGQTYLVGTNNDRSNDFIARKIVGLFGADESVINYVPDRHSNDRRYAIDATKITTELGWKPDVGRDNFEESLKETIKWYKENQAWWRPLLEKQDVVSDSTGRLSAFISLDRVWGKTKFTFNNSGTSVGTGTPGTKPESQDFLEEHGIRYNIVLKNLESKAWYINSETGIREKISELAKNPETFGYVESLAGREDGVEGKKILSLSKIEHAPKEAGIYGIATWFEVEESLDKKVLYGYYSWGMGSKSGSKIILLIKTAAGITHLGLIREQKIPTGYVEYALPGGFANINEGLLDLLLRYIKTDFKFDILKGEMMLEKITSLGRLNPDSGMTDNRPSLYSVTAELRNNYKNIGKDETVEEDPGIVLWPISKIEDLINKCDDAFLLSAVARLSLSGTLSDDNAGKNNL